MRVAVRTEFGGGVVRWSALWQFSGQPLYSAMCMWAYHDNYATNVEMPKSNNAVG